MTGLPGGGIKGFPLPAPGNRNIVAYLPEALVEGSSEAGETALKTNIFMA
jgi:hypothetical protein